MTAALERLHASAKQNKPVSDVLSRSVAAVERELGRLNLRVASWTMLSERIGNDGVSFRREYVGYIEHDKRWRVVLSSDRGSDNQPDEDVVDVWPFDEAPQYLRAKAIDKLPDLIDALAATVDKTTERLTKRLDSAVELSAVITASSAKKKVKP
jgi:hypothetical protein